MTELSVGRKTTNTYKMTFTTNGSVQDITGWTIFFTIKKNVSQLDSAALISKTITTHSDPTQGISLLVLSSSDTDISSGNYVYDIRFKDTSNNIYAISPDNFIVLDYITQRTS